MATKELFLTPIANLSSIEGRKYFRANDEIFVQDVDGTWFTSDKRGEPIAPVSVRPIGATLCAVSSL